MDARRLSTTLYVPNTAGCKEAQCPHAVSPTQALPPRMAGTPHISCMTPSIRFTLQMSRHGRRQHVTGRIHGKWQGNRNKLHWAARGSPSPHRAALGSTGTQHIQLAYFDCLEQLLELSLVCSRRGVGEGGTTEIRQSRTAARLNSSASHTLIKAGEVQQSLLAHRCCRARPCRPAVFSMGGRVALT